MLTQTLRPKSVDQKSKSQLTEIASRPNQVDRKFQKVNWPKIVKSIHISVPNNLLVACSQLFIKVILVHRLYSRWLDQLLVGWIRLLLLQQSFFLFHYLPQEVFTLARLWPRCLGFLVFAPTIAYCLLFNIGAIILRPDKYNIMSKIRN